ncbi:MAG: hypothetical protein WBG11_15035 [Methylocella sp.]
MVGYGGANGVSYGFAFVASRIVERDDIAWPRRRDETLLDIGEEPRANDRAVE